MNVIQGHRSFQGQILKFEHEFNQGHQRSIHGHHHILKAQALTLTKLAKDVALDLSSIIGGHGQGHTRSNVTLGSNLKI